MDPDLKQSERKLLKSFIIDAKTAINVYKDDLNEFEICGIWMNIFDNNQSIQASKWKKVTIKLEKFDLFQNTLKEVIKFLNDEKKKVNHVKNK